MAAGAADFIVDLVSTGSTLVQNHLKEIDTILETQACFISSCGYQLSEEATKARSRIVEQVEARINATRFSILRFQASCEESARICNVLIERHGCTLASRTSAECSEGDGSCDNVILCTHENLFSAVSAIRQVVGGKLVIVEECKFLFKDHSHVLDKMRRKEKWVQRNRARPARSENA